MKHRALEDFWVLFDRLPRSVRRVARKNFELLKSDPSHPSLRFKRVVEVPNELWSVRVGLGFRALGRKENATVYWFWIGTHAEYDRLIS